jgi:hypothetical protein
MTTAKILNDFKKNVDMTKSYTIDELCDVLKTSFEKVNNTKKKEKGTRAPTEYNIFMKENMLLVKQENPEMTAKDVMKSVAKMWSERKDKSTS